MGFRVVGTGATLGTGGTTLEMAGMSAEMDGRVARIFGRSSLGRCRLTNVSRRTEPMPMRRRKAIGPSGRRLHNGCRLRRTRMGG
jgi:hypothetical protein